MGFKQESFLLDYIILYPSCCSLSETVEPEDVPTESTEVTADQLFNQELMFPSGQDKSVPWNAISAYESMKARRLTEHKKWKELVSFLKLPGALCPHLRLG